MVVRRYGGKSWIMKARYFIKTFCSFKNLLPICPASPFLHQNSTEEFTEVKTITSQIFITTGPKNLFVKSWITNYPGIRLAA